MTSITECLFCGGARHTFCFRASDRWHDVPGQYDVYSCNDCGLLFLNPQPSPQQIAAHYPVKYYALQGERPYDARDERLYRGLFGKNAGPLQKLLALPFRPFLRTMVGGPGQRVLDVGCGSGHFLALQKSILGMEGYGIEPYSYDVDFASRNQLNIFHGTLEEAAFPDAFFDVITMNHVFEHVAGPRQTLCELKRVLKPGGSLIIGVPQSQCLLYWIFGKHWLQLDVPRHLFVPSSQNLERLARTLGFQVQRTRYNSNPSSVVASLYYWYNHFAGRRKFLDQFEPGSLWVRAALPLAYVSNWLRVADQIEMFLTIGG